jgi:hypothetical protein
MFSVFGKIKAWIIAGLAAALPIVYVVGRLIGRAKGRAAAENERTEDANKSAKEVADFYREMANDEEITNGNLNDRDRVSQRLRDKGL